ncbi:MAG TPA: nucleotide sugar dehydrogenase [Candidatus Sulfotelmatobacter sp.]|nr:nucleotide sugar dehydrogenase [Candidatus Sulfotelmatobacter sp.]
MTKISVIGLGYVGAVTAGCLAAKGYEVLGVDVNPLKVELLESGKAPVLEPGLDELVEQAHRAGRLHATTNATEAVHKTDLSFVCVGTPSLRNGRLDLSGVERSCRECGEALRGKKGFHWFVLRSTILPGTAEKLAIPAIEKASGKKEGVDFAVCTNPEFTREGCAVSDFLNPPITVLGASNPAHLEPLREIYSWAKGKIFETSFGVSEMVKYVCNTFHALKVSFANEIGVLCREMGVDAQAVTEIYTSDTKLNASAAYLTPGFAFGGSCLPKDVKALTYRAKELDQTLPLLGSIMSSNQAHIDRAVDMILHTRKKKIGVLGLSFKAKTDDLRESPMVQLIKRLLGEGCEVAVWDPDVAMGRLVGSNRQFIEDEIPHIGSLLQSDLNNVVAKAEVVVIGTTAFDSAVFKQSIAPGQVVFDVVHARNVLLSSQEVPVHGLCW